MPSFYIGVIILGVAGLAAAFTSPSTPPATQSRPASGAPRTYLLDGRSLMETRRRAKYPPGN